MEQPMPGKASEQDKSKARKPSQSRGKQTRMKIIKAAVGLFSTQGYHVTNSKEIARAAGVSTGCFYAYFNDKLEVFREVLGMYMESFDQEVFSQLRDNMAFMDNPRTGIRRTIEALIHAHRVFDGFHDELLAMQYTDPSIRQIIRDKHLVSFRNTLEVMTQWREFMTVRDFDASAEITYHAISMVVDAILFLPSDLPRERQVDALTEMVCRFLFGSDGAAGTK